MFAMFMETSFAKKEGFVSMINMHSWMFLTSFCDLRNNLLRKNQIITMVHLGAHAFETIGGEIVQTTSFVLRNTALLGNGTFYKLDSIADKEQAFIRKENQFITPQTNFFVYPEQILAYWLSDAYTNIFSNTDRISLYASPKQGMSTCDVNRFVKLWYEVDINKTNLFNPKNHNRWVKYNKGGEFRKWYGNREYIVLWNNDGNLILQNKGALRNKDVYFQDFIAWSKLASVKTGFRNFETDFLFDGAGGSLFVARPHIKMYLLGMLNSKVLMNILSVISPTLNFNENHIAALPTIIHDEKKQIVEDIVNGNISLSQLDWDSFETSWDFQEHPLVRWSKGLWDVTAIGATMYHYYGGHPKVNSSLELCYMLWQGECKERFNQLKSNEEKLNKIFIDIYGLQDELTPEVEDKDVTVRLADKERDIKSLVSYLVGIIMGRYSLNREGLQYAGGLWDVLKYDEPLDDDGIIPIYSSLGMEDGLTTKIITLIKNIFGEDDYRSNIDFIADALGKKSNESSEETLNRYLNEGFYNDHLKIYQKRPIYWMFSSGKNSGFKCLIYMHRYNADTLARINGKYFLPESTRIKNELDEINTSISTAEGRDRIRLEKERQKLAAKYNEAIEYGQVLDHMANKFIDIDLDDGVKVNYAKFQGVELVTDNGTKVKKDLLVSIK